MIGRRGFITGLSGSALLGVRPVAAQKVQRRVVGLAFPNTPAAEMAGLIPSSPLVRAFLEGVRSQGTGQSGALVVERRSAEGAPSRAPGIIGELLGSGAEVLALGGARWLHDAALSVTSTTPLVGLFAGDPVADGLVESLARPRRNLTGLTLAPNAEFASKQLQILREIAPHVERPALLANGEALKQFLDVARFPGVTIIPARVDAPGEYAAAFADIVRLGADALIVAGGPPNVVNAERIVVFSNASRLPTIYGFREAVTAGGLISYGVSFPSLFHQLGRMTEQFLDGARIGELPVEQPTTFELVANLKAARTLGLTLPLLVLAQADEVIE